MGIGRFGDKADAARVQTELARQIKDRINAAMEVNLKRQAEFDEDTSCFSTRAAAVVVMDGGG